MYDEDLLYEELADVPPVPSNAFSQIEKKIKGNTFRKNIAFTIAAALILSTGTQIWFFAKQSVQPTLAVGYTVGHTDADATAPIRTARVVPTEVAYELQIARDFISGNDVDNDTEQYAFLNNDDR